MPINDHLVLIKDIDSPNVFTCGDNDFYEQSGDGNATNVLTAMDEMIPKVVQGYAGRNRSHFITEDGELWGVGRNNSGELGVGHYTDVVVPVREGNGFTDWVKVQTFGGSTVAHRSDGSLWVTGDNYGRLGFGAFTQPLGVFIQYTVVPGTLKIISGEGDDTLLLNEAGEIYFSGSDDPSIVGLPNSSYDVFTKVAHAKTDWEHLYFAGYEGVLLDSLGDVYAFGEFYQATWMDGYRDVDDMVPFLTKINELSSIARVSIDKEGAIWVIKTDGSLWAIGGVYNEGASTRYPTLTNMSPNGVYFAEIMGTSGYPLFLDTSNNIWGFYGAVLGDGSYSDGDHTTLIQAAYDTSEVQLFDTITGQKGRSYEELSEPDSHFLLVQDSAAPNVLGSGGNYSYEQSGTSEAVISEYTYIDELSDKVVKAYRGTYCSLFLTEAGEIFGVGDNSNGNLGLGHTSGAEVPEQEFNKYTDWQDIFPTAYATFATRSNGSVWTTWNRSTYVAMPSAPNNVEYISGSGDDVMLLTTDGLLYLLGDEYPEVVGLGSGDYDAFIPIPSSKTDWVQIQHYGSEGLLVDSVGDVYLFGDFYPGVFDAYKDDGVIPFPTKITELSKVKRAYIAQDRSVWVVKEDGTLWVIGGGDGEGVVYYTSLTDKTPSGAAMHEILLCDRGEHVFLDRNNTIWSFYGPYINDGTLNLYDELRQSEYDTSNMLWFDSIAGQVPPYVDVEEAEGSLELPSLQCDGYFSHHTAAGTLELPSLQAYGEATLNITTEATLPVFDCDGTMLHDNSFSGRMNLPVFRVGGAALAETQFTGAVTIPMMSARGSFETAINMTADIQLVSFSASGTVVRNVSVSGHLDLPVFDVEVRCERSNPFPILRNPS